MKISFKYKFILSFVTIELCFLTIIILFNFNSLKKASYQLLDEKIEASTNLFSNLILTPLMVYDLAMIDNQVEGFASLKNIAAVIIEDGEGHIVSEFARDHHDELFKLLRSPFSDDEIYREGRTYVARETPLLSYRARIGTIKILFDITSNKEAIFYNRNVTLSIALIEVLISMVVSICIGYSLTRSLTQLRDITHHIAEKEDTQIEFVIDSGDEIEDLADSICIMQEKIYDRTTQLMKTTEALKRVNQELECRIAEEVLKNLQKDRMLMNQARLASMGEMIGAIAHHWRQPLNSLGLLIQDVEDAYEYNELSRDYLSSLVNESMEILKGMSYTIDKFRDFFLPSDQKALFSMKEAITSTLSLMKETLEYHKIAIDLDIRKDSEIEGYYSDLKQVLLNIITNSKDALTENKIENPWVSISLYEMEAYFFIDIADNGGGISANIIDKVFDPYFTTKEEGKGTGIGLYMSKMFIERHMNGRLSVENTDGGVTFRIALKV